jgi:hypothetical protein
MIVGILLLVIFGSHAAAQARNMKLAGASHKSIFAVGTDIMSVLGFSKTDPVVRHEPQPISSHVPAEIGTATPIGASPATSDNTDNKQVVGSTETGAAVKANGGQHKATGTVNNVTDKTQQVVNNVTKNTTNDFTNLWP